MMLISVFTWMLIFFIFELVDWIHISSQCCVNQALFYCFYEAVSLKIKQSYVFLLSWLGIIYWLALFFFLCLHILNSSDNSCTPTLTRWKKMKFFRRSFGNDSLPLVKIPDLVFHESLASLLKFVHSWYFYNRGFESA